jgi:hypothetical protein
MFDPNSILVAPGQPLPTAHDIMHNPHRQEVIASVIKPVQIGEDIIVSFANEDVQNATYLAYITPANADEIAEVYALQIENPSDATALSIVISSDTAMTDEGPYPVIAAAGILAEAAAQVTFTNQLFVDGNGVMIKVSNDTALGVADAFDVKIKFFQVK